MYKARKKTNVSYYIIKKNPKKVRKFTIHTLKYDKVAEIAPTLQSHYFA